MKEIIGFFGGDHQTGTTMTAWSFAERLSEQGQKVLLILGSGSDDQALLPLDGGHSIDELKAGIRSGFVERDDLMQCLEKRKALWILPGIRNRLTAGQFMENTFEILLEDVQHDFDYIVIDGGSDVRLGLTVSALNVCTIRYFVVTQQPKVIHRYLQCRQQFLEPLGLEGRLILNLYRKDPAVFLKGDIAKLTGAEKVNIIPYVQEGWQVEMEQKNLLAFSRFCSSIDELATVFLPKEKKEGKWKKRFI